MNNPPTSTSDTDKAMLEKCLHDWVAIKKIDIRKRIKAIKSFCSSLIYDYEKNRNENSIAKLDLYIMILTEAIKMRFCPPKYSKSVSMMTLDKLTLTGNANVTIMSKLAGSIAVESGLIMMGDPSIQIEDEFDYHEKKAARNH